MTRLYCTKNHRIRGLWYDAALGTLVRLEAAFVVVGYGNECRLDRKPFRTPGFDGPEGTEWRERPWVL